MSKEDLEEKEIPPSLPKELVTMRRAGVTALVRANYNRLEKAGWSGQKIEAIEVEHFELLRKYRDEDNFKKSIDDFPTDGSFKDAWKLVSGLKVLEEFCGGFASIFPTTAPVEADFSLIGMEKAHRESLTDFSLEGCLHAKQFELLQSIK